MRSGRSVAIISSNHLIRRTGRRALLACPRLFFPYLIRSSLPIRARSPSPPHHIKRPAPTTRTTGRRTRRGRADRVADCLLRFVRSAVCFFSSCGYRLRRRLRLRRRGICARQCRCLIPVRVFHFVFFPFRPTPSLLALSHPPASIIPPPAGRGTRGRR